MSKFQWILNSKIIKISLFKFDTIQFVYIFISVFWILHSGLLLYFIVKLYWRNSEEIKIFFY